MTSEQAPPAAENDFTSQPQAPSAPREVACEFGGREWRFRTDRGVFSQGRVDPGTRLLLRTVTLPDAARFVDWGCGYGPVGLCLAARHPQATAVLVDVNLRAVRLARHNAFRHDLVNVQVIAADGLTCLRGGKVLDAVVSNPPIRAGRTTLRRLFAETAQRLRLGGSLWVVVRTKQGARSLARDLTELVGPTDTLARGGGYRVLRALRQK